MAQPGYDGSLNPLTQKIRAKYPGAYDDLDDATLTKKVLAKYPQYSDLAAPAMPKVPASVDAAVRTAPEESGLTTGPIMSPHTEENTPTAAGGDPVAQRVFAREVHAGAKALKDMIPGAYHALTDPASTPEEQAIVGPHQGGGLSLAIHRLITQPVKNAISDYASGRVTPDAALSVAPEAVGSAGANVITGKLIDKLPEATPYAKAFTKPVAKSLWNLADEADVIHPGRLVTRGGPKVVDNFKGSMDALQDELHKAQPPKPRPEPAWKTQNTEGEPVPSVLDREPVSSGPGRQNFPSKTAKPARVPMWKKLQDAAAADAAENAPPSAETPTEPAQPVEQPAPASPQAPKSGASVKMFVSNRDVQALRDLGWDDATINKMKPDEAQANIDGKIRPATAQHPFSGPTDVPPVNDPAMADVETAQRGRINELDQKYPVQPGSAVLPPDPFKQPPGLALTLPEKQPIATTLSKPDVVESRNILDQIRNYAGPEDPSEEAVGAIHRRLFSEGSSARSPKGDAVAMANGEEPSEGPVNYTKNKVPGLDTAPMAEKVSVLQRLKEMAARKEISPEGMDLMQKLQTMLDAAKQKNVGRF